MDIDLRTAVKGMLYTHFPNESAMHVDDSNRSDIAGKIRKILSHFSYIELDKPRHQSRSGYTSRRQLLTFTVNLPIDYTFLKYKFDDFVIEHNSKDELILYYEGNRFNVSSLDKIEMMARDCQLIAEVRHAEDTQQRMIQDLQTQSTLAHMRKLVEEEGYTFATLGSGGIPSKDMSIYIKIGEDQMLSLTLPYEHFPDTLDLIQPTTETMRAVHEMGISLDVEKIPPDDWFHCQWIKPESADEEERDRL
ncbi:MAG: hypothetical protein AAF639_38710 [Chloroflexota bacterium]